MGGLFAVRGERRQARRRVSFFRRGARRADTERPRIIIAQIGIRVGRNDIRGDAVRAALYYCTGGQSMEVGPPALTMNGVVRISEMSIFLFNWGDS
jgi:hypothetical protein